MDNGNSTNQSNISENNSEKIENQLNLAIDVGEGVREETIDLDAGYLNNDKWELIIKYTGAFSPIEEYVEEANILLNGFAIVVIRESQINKMAALPQVIYVEKPKRLYYEVVNAIRSSCISPVQDRYNLFGEGIFVAVIDSGIDYKNPVFIDENGKSRIECIWDQTDSLGTPPAGYSRGSLYNNEEINRAINGEETINTVDLSGHGTAVASIACGNFAGNKRNSVGIATKSKLIAVKLGNPFRDNFPKTSELMLAIDFVIRYAITSNTPVVINISFGNNYGSHDGTSLVEQYINSVSGVGRNTIVVGMGNEGAAAGHYRANLQNNQNYIIDVAVGNYESKLNMQLWKNYSDEFFVEIISPSGNTSGILNRSNEGATYILDNTTIYVYYGTPKPFSVAQEIYFEFVPREDYLLPGIYSIKITPVTIKNGEVNLWLPVESAINNTRFLGSSPEITITSPATAYSVISVGAYNSFTNSYAEFSGRGFLRENNFVKPDIVAPGVNIRGATREGTALFTGTSFATPVVSGSVALLMEWGIVRRNDIYLYADKVKAYLIKGAVPLANEPVPSKRTGWGALCLNNSIPK